MLEGLTHFPIKKVNHFFSNFNGGLPLFYSILLGRSWDSLFSILKKNEKKKNNVFLFDFFRAHKSEKEKKNVILKKVHLRMKIILQNLKCVLWGKTFKSVSNPHINFSKHVLSLTKVNVSIKILETFNIISLTV